MDPIYAVPTVLLTDDFTEWSVYLRNSGKAFVVLWLGFFSSSCVCVCPCVGTMSLAPTDRRDEAWPLWVLLCSLFLSSITVSPPPSFCSPRWPGCSYLSAVKDFDRKGNPTLGVGGRGGGGSRSFLELVFTLHFSQKGLPLVVQPARFLTRWRGVWLQLPMATSPIYLYCISRKEKKKSTPNTEAGDIKSDTLSTQSTPNNRGHQRTRGVEGYYYYKSATCWLFVEVFRE